MITEDVGKRIKMLRNERGLTKEKLENILKDA